MSINGVDSSGGGAAASARNGVRRLEETIGRIVGRMFYGTLMQQMRDSTLKGSFGHGGRGEEIFAAQLHGLLAERMGVADRDAIGKVLISSLRPQQERVAAKAARHLGTNR